MKRLTLFLGLLMLAGTPQVQADQVMAVLGNVILVHQDQQFQAIKMARLRMGDSLLTSSNSGVSFTLDNGTFVHSGPNAKIQIQREGIRLYQGQIRILSRPDQSTTVLTAEGNLIANGGIHLVGVSGEGTRFASQIGAATLDWKPSPQWSHNRPDSRSNRVAQVAYQQETLAGKLPEQHETHILNGQILSSRPVSSRPWNIRVAQLQQQAVGDAAGGVAGQPAGTAQGQNQGQNQTQPFDDDQRLNPANDNLADNQRSGANQNQDDGNRRRPPDVAATQYGGSSLAAAFGGFSSGAGFSASGAGNSDANQATTQGKIVSRAGDTRFTDGDPFPGNIHLVTSDTKYNLTDLKADTNQVNSVAALNSNHYYSIGDGPLPTTQVSTEFATGTNVSPNAIPIPGTNSYVVQLDQYGINDPAFNNGSTTGITGLIGNPPTAPMVTGATPQPDTRAQSNRGATFALGEFRVGQNTDGQLEFAVRRSDQDRIIIDNSLSGPSDANDIVIPNTDVQFADAVDARFLPAAPLVKVPIPDSFGVGSTNFRDLNKLRRGAATVVLADQLFDIANATGQTRFAVEGKIIDISGFQRP